MAQATAPLLDSTMLMRKPTRQRDGEGCHRWGSERGSTQRFHRGNGGSMRAQGDRSNTGNPERRLERDRPTGIPRGTGRAIWGDGWVRKSEEAGQCRQSKGALVQDKRTKW